MNEEKERHQNLHFQNLFIPESCKYYSAYNVIVLCPIVNGCLHKFLGFFFVLFFLTLGIVSASKICLCRLLRDSLPPNVKIHEHVLTQCNLLRLSRVPSYKKSAFNQLGVIVR